MVGVGGAYSLSNAISTWNACMNDPCPMHIWG